MDRDLRGWRTYEKPEFRVRFFPVDPRKVT